MKSIRLFAIVIICMPSLGWAGYLCSIDHGYPEVSDIAVQSGVWSYCWEATLTTIDGQKRNQFN